MKPLLFSIFAVSTLLASPSAIADNHGSQDHHADQPAPTHEDCMALHETMAGMHEAHATEADAETTPGMDDEQRDMMMACHSMMEDMHAAHGEGDVSNHGSMDGNNNHADGHGNHGMDEEEASSPHDH